jgi:hypothetical protein
MKIPQYRIHWRSNLTGFTGNGSTAYPEVTAQEIADKLNSMLAYKRDGITHWIEPVKVAPVVRPSYTRELPGAGRRHLKGLE